MAYARLRQPGVTGIIACSLAPGFNESARAGIVYSISFHKYVGGL